VTLRSGNGPLLHTRQRARSQRKGITVDCGPTRLRSRYRDTISLRDGSAILRTDVLFLYKPPADISRHAWGVLHQETTCTRMYWFVFWSSKPMLCSLTRSCCRGNEITRSRFGSLRPRAACGRWESRSRSRSCPPTTGWPRNLSAGILHDVVPR